MHLFIGILFSLVASSALAEVKLKKNLTFSSVNYCPLICDDNEKPGIMVEIAREVFQKYGVKINVQLVPFSRAITLATEGKTDGLIAGSKDQAPKLLFPNQVTLYQYVKFFKRKSSKWKYNNTKSLDKVTLGAVKGYGWANKEIDEYVQKNSKVIKISQKLGTPHLIKLLSKKRVDLFIDGHLSGKYHISKSQSKSIIEEDQKIIGRFENYISFSPNLKNAEEYIKILNNETKRLRKSGFYQKTLLKYGIKDSLF
jgi:polar amino acid transport system substrate-binding protein